MNAETKLCWMLSDGLALEGAKITSFFQEALPKSAVLYGNAATDNFALVATHQFFCGEILEGAVPYLLFEGNLAFSSGMTKVAHSGWEIIGDKYPIVSKGHKILKIGGQAAITFVESRFMLHEGMMSVNHPLAIYDSAQAETPLYFRDMVAYDEVDGSIETLYPLPAKCWVQLTHPVVDKIIETTRQASLSAFSSFPTMLKPSVCLWTSCVSRA